LAWPRVLLLLTIASIPRVGPLGILGFIALVLLIDVSTELGEARPDESSRPGRML